MVLSVMSALSQDSWSELVSPSICVICGIFSWVRVVVLVDASSDTVVKLLAIGKVLHENRRILAIALEFVRIVRSLSQYSRAELVSASVLVICGVSSWVWMSVLVDPTTNAVVKLFGVCEIFNENRRVVSVAIEFRRVLGNALEWVFLEELINWLIWR